MIFLPYQQANIAIENNRQSMWRSRTFWRLLGTIGVLILFSIGIVGVVTVRRFERFYWQQFEDTLRAKAIFVRAMVRQSSGPATSENQQQIRDLGVQTRTRITLIDDAGRVLADSAEDPEHMENHSQRPEVVAARAGEFGMAQRFSDTLRQMMMYVAVPVNTPDEKVQYVRVALPLDEIEQQLARLRRFVWTTAAVTGVAVSLLAFWPALRITRPLRELTKRVERLAAGTGGQRVYAADSGEVGTLARTFNRMSDQLSAHLAQIEADRQQLRAILDGMVEGVVALDAREEVLFANDRAARFLEFNAISVVGRKFWEVVRQRPMQDLVRQALHERTPCSKEMSYTGSATRSCMVHAVRLSDAAGGVVLVIHDTTELRHLERLRQEFVANVSHELKTPLAVIKASLETLLDGAIDDPSFGRRFLQRAASQAEHLHVLIQDLLSLARIESGQEVFDIQSVAIESAVAACLDRHRDRAAKKNQSLRGAAEAGDGGADAPLAVWADEDALAHVLDNLVDNAVKYTPDGGIVDVRWRPSNGEICIQVSDTGVGIPQRDLARVFERFFRVDKARSRELGGTGLGLAIVKHLVQGMRGQVAAASTEGKGSTFTVRLPRVTDS